MPRMTVLDLVQRILSKIEGDEVNSINDTIEATQVAYVIRDCYDDIVEEMDLSFKGDLIKLESAVDDTHPTLMKMPDQVGQVEWINYSKPAPTNPAP